MTTLQVIRQTTRNGFTPGYLTWDGKAECFTCEDPIREIPGQPVAKWKIFGETAIPAGTYQVIIDHSEHFEKRMPHVLDVPGFEGIRIHIGNRPKDTEGCLLLGDVIAADGVASSTAAFNEFMQKLETALAAGEVWITYVNPPVVVS